MLGVPGSIPGRVITKVTQLTVDPIPFSVTR